MRVMVQLLAPGVEHRKAPDLGAEILGIPSDILERLRDGTKEQPVEEAGVCSASGPRSCGRVKMTWQ